MGAPVLTIGSTVLCAHGGKVTLMPAPRVKANGQPVVLMAIPSPVAGCPNPPPPANLGPCVLVNWISGTVRVMVSGQPILMATSASVAVPTGLPASVVSPEPRVMVT